MRRLLILLYVSLLLLSASGCAASLAADRHDAERLLLIQTMGLDSLDGGVEMSVSSGLGPEDKPALVMSTAASGIEDAIARLQNYSPENQLFYAHVQYLLLGQSAAAGYLDSVIEWVDRSPTLPMDTDLLIVRGDARDAVVDASRENTDITQRLASLDRQARSTGWRIYTLREVAAALAEGQGALCLAVETAPSEERVFTDGQQSDAVVPAGYAVLDGGGLVGFLSPEASLGAGLLTDEPTGLLFTVEGCTMELLEGRTEIDARFGPDGAPAEIDVRCALRTGMLERPAGGAPAGDELDAALSQTAADWIGQALAVAREKRCDFLGLEQAVLAHAPDRDAARAAWDTAFPTLPINITVEGRVDRNYDLAG